MIGSSLASFPAARGLRLVLALWLVLGAACAVRTVIWPEKRTVFTVFAAAANHWWADQPLYYPYDGNIGGFRCSPLFAIFMTPFAALGSTAGGVLWCWFGLGIYGLGLYRFVRDVLPESWPPWGAALFHALALWGAVRGAWNGQANMLVAGCLLLAASAWVRERWWQTALLLGAAVFLKLSPIAVALLFCALAPRRLAPRFALVLLLGAALPVFTRSPDIVVAQYHDWYAHLTGNSGARWPGLRDAWTVWLLARHWQGAIVDLRMTVVDTPAYRGLQLAAAAALLGWCLWQNRRALSRRHVAAFTLGGGCAYLMLFGPATEFPTFVILAPLTAYAVVDALAFGRNRFLAGAAWVLTAVLPWNATTGQFQDALPILFAVLPAGAACAMLWLIVHAWRAPAAQPLQAIQPGTIINDEKPQPQAA